MARTLKGVPTRSIVVDPRICGGEPTVEGTRVPVSAIVLQWRATKDPKLVREAFPHLSPQDISHALKYYDSHQVEIDRLIEESERAAYAAD